MGNTALIDRLATRLWGLPASTTSFTVHRDVPVPMRDGVVLLADHYAPHTDRPVGTILVRGPYGRAFAFSMVYARIYAARGYHVVFQSVRGTFGSGGQFVPMAQEFDDAIDTVVWLREQPWFTGTFATLGLSYLGFTQWALMADPPPELVAAVVAVGPHNMHTSSWGTGAFALNDLLGWADMMDHQNLGLIKGVSFQLKLSGRLARTVGKLPLGEAGRALLADSSQWYESWLMHPDPEDPYWTPRRTPAALENSTVPVLLISGWQDVFLDQSVEQFRQLRRRGVNVAMTVGPWTHDQMVTRATSITATSTLSWLGSHFAGEPPARSHPVRVAIGGDWLDLPDWPPATRESVLYPQPSGALGADAPDAATTASFRFDPADPTPTLGGRTLSRQGGYCNDTALAGRDDVLSFTSAPLNTDLSIAGNPAVELDYHCSTAHFDVFVRVSEVDSRGRSRNVSDGYQRFSTVPGAPIRISLDPVAHRFSAGSRIRLMVAGGCHPRFARNLGTGEPVGSGEKMVAATHTVRFGEQTALSLPVLDDSAPSRG